ncbi:hypothetical protein [Streptococcus equinus]|uniref:hypothetical protein n=1 Tax=Streptococcus equinus TaxID=1335 RepID=UPI001FB2FAF1|nr:hypothetical protein [Streptococcus equinus]UOC11393.1 hypothetical protein KIP81_01485 [Streptococcus equinus]
MHKTYLVYRGKSYYNYGIESDGSLSLTTSDSSSAANGFQLVTSKFVNPYYKKNVKKEDIEKKYRITDTALINGRECEIFQSSDDNFDQPDSWITIVTDDVEFLKANDIWEGAEVVDNQYGHRFYHSSRIPVSEVTILRTREDLPID